MWYIEFPYTFLSSFVFAWWWPTFGTKTSHQVKCDYKAMCCVWLKILIYTHYWYTNGNVSYNEYTDISFLLQEEEIVKPRHSKKRKKVNPVGSDSDWPSTGVNCGNICWGDNGGYLCRHFILWGFINSSVKHNAWTVIKLLLDFDSQMKSLKIISNSRKLHSAWSRYRIIFCYFDRKLVFE